MAGGFDPFVVVGEATLGADSADDHVSGDGRLGAAFEDAVKDDAKAFAAFPDEAGGREVAVEGSGREAIFAANVVRA